MKKKPLRLAVIGGAINSAVGRAHHIAAQMDGRFHIVAGNFSTHFDNNLTTAQMLDIPEEKIYKDWKTLLEKECKFVDAVLLLTPTPLHAEMAITSLEHNIPVISEKPLCVSPAEAINISKARYNHNGYVAVIYNYTGYPMIRELQNLIKNCRLGQITQVVAEMPQEGFLRLVGGSNSTLQPQPWRLDDYSIPMVSLDLGVHLHHLIYFLTGRRPLEVSALEQNQGYFPGIIDNVQCLARYSGNLPVQIWYGKTALGYANGLRIRIFGTLGSAEWVQMNPEYLLLSDNQGNTLLNTRSTNGMEICNLQRYARFKAGHPAGFIEALANYYNDIADSIESHLQDNSQNRHPFVSSIEEALEGLTLMDAITKSAKNHKWVTVAKDDI